MESCLLCWLLQDVAALHYRAPRLAVDCLTQAVPGLPHGALILDVACGTGLVAVEVRHPTAPPDLLLSNIPQHTPTPSLLPTCSLFLHQNPRDSAFASD